MTLEIQGLREGLGLKGAKGALAAPLLKDFSERFLEEYAKANRQKPRGIASKESHLRIHWLPRLGKLPLDSIRDSDIQRFKADLAEHSPKTVNNILSTLSKLLKVAVDWGVLEQLPVKIKPLHSEPPIVRFFDFASYMRLVAHAEELDIRTLVLVLLGGDAGLRMGEMIGLEWPDVDWELEQLTIQRSESKRIVTLPKSGSKRYVPMTRKLLAALKQLVKARKGGQKRMLLRDDGKSVSEQTMETWFTRAQLAANLADVSTLGALHQLRHTYCSHLAMKGASVIAIQHLAGHSDLRTTQRYMHLAPTEARNAVALLDERHSDGKRKPHAHR